MKALIVVDIQKDFCPGGSLAVPNGDEIIPVINELLSQFELIIFTKDWHHPKMNAFASQHTNKKPFDNYINSQGNLDVLWPDHCVEDTDGSEFHENLDLSKCKKDFYIFKKGNQKEYHPYSGFDGTNLDEFLKLRGVNEVLICGLAFDYCVADTAIDAIKYGFKTSVIKNACKPIHPDISGVEKKFKELNINLV